METNQIIQILKSGEVGVMPTDTIYGIVGSALNSQTVEKIYDLRKRAPSKPMIILISSLDDLDLFKILLTESQKEFLQRNWPNPLSVVLECLDPKFEYLHRGTKSLAFRMPKDEQLLEILKQTGPLVAPSANFEGKKLSESITEAKEYFGENLSFYEDIGEIKSQPSTLIKLNTNGLYEILRQGSFTL